MQGTATFAEHISELRRRLMWSLSFVLLGASTGYLIRDTLLAALQRPLNESLYYTTPGGAMSFIIKVCSVFGILVALPVLTYHGFAFFEPLIQTRTRRMLFGYIGVSIGLALAGMAFAYFISLPIALYFLTNFGTDSGIISIITANEYFNFVMAYIVGFAFLFQVPLIMVFINRIKPVPPSKLISASRYVILAVFILAAIVTPPDPITQFILAGPVILLYFVSVVVIAFKNRRRARSARPMSADTVSLPDPASEETRQTLQSKQPASPTAHNIRHQKESPPNRMPTRSPARPNGRTGDISPSRQRAVYQSRRATVQPKKRPSSPPSRTRLISDFIPATD